MNIKKISCLSLLAVLAVLLITPNASAWRGVIGDGDKAITFNKGFVYIPQNGVKEVYPFLDDLTNYGYMPEKAKIHMYVTNPTCRTLEFTYFINGKKYQTVYVGPGSARLIESPVDHDDLIYGEKNTITFETSADPIVSGYMATKWIKTSYIAESTE
ncbi:MAG: hypothetical protein ABIG84_03410 [archaeon]